MCGRDLEGEHCGFLCKCRIFINVLIHRRALVQFEQKCKDASSSTFFSSNICLKIFLTKIANFLHGGVLRFSCLWVKMRLAMALRVSRRVHISQGSPYYRAHLPLYQVQLPTCTCKSRHTTCVTQHTHVSNCRVQVHIRST